MMPDSNPYSKAEENQASFWRRFYIYQKERFPLLSHGLLVASFSFSAIAYSRICRGQEGFVSGPVYLLGCATTITLFLLLRIMDEFKDAEDDARFRRELPVPRGVISFRELTVIGVTLVIFQLTLHLSAFPRMLTLYALVITYLCLMGKEFFISSWLKRHQFWYVSSHMLIVPLIDIYASGLDWFLAGVPAPKGLLFFFAVSYMNGLVLEVGRKIRMPGKEAEGVLTYSAMLGAAKATWLWLGILFLTLCLSTGAAFFAGYGLPAFIVLSSVFVLCSIPAWCFLYCPDEKAAKHIEKASGFWTIAMYLCLGAIPMLQKMIIALWNL